MTPLLIAFLGTALLALMLVMDTKARIVLVIASVTIALAAPGLADLIVARMEAASSPFFVRLSGVADER